MGAELHSFGPFSIDRDAATLLRDGKAIAVGQRALALLVALAETDGPVTKAALIEAAWPGTIVEEGNLTVQIAALRKALGVRPDGSEWIVTVPRIGYRLIHGEAGLGGIRASRPAIAVLPFVAIGGETDHGALADGIVEDLITALSRFRTFSVAARNSSFVYKDRSADVREIARELGVSYIVEGSVRRIADRLRISAQLVSAETGGHLWARTFDGTLETIFDLQDRITFSIAAAADLEIRRAEEKRAEVEGANSSEPYMLYQRAMSKLGTMSPGPSAEGLALLERAIAIDPNYEEAIAMAAWGYEHRLHMGWPALGADDMGKCLALARRALATTRGDARVIAHCGVILQQCAQEWDQGLRTIERAIELNPSDPAALFFGGVGNLKGGTLESAETHFEKALSIDSAGGDGGLAGIGHVRLSRGRYEEAIDFGARALAVNPRFGWIHWLMICGNAHLGRQKEAKRALAVYRDLFPEARLGRIRIGNQMRDMARAEIVFEGLRLAGMPE
jgi:TolB-like protein/Tfp pilus assembly protein PilF